MSAIPGAIAAILFNKKKTMKYRNCSVCGEEMQIINTSDGPTYSRIFLDDGETASLYACTSRDCKNRGIVMMIPHAPKED